MSSPPPDPRGLAYAAASAMLYGTAYVATGIALRVFSPLSAAIWRGVIGAVAIGLLLTLPAFAGMRLRQLSRAATLRLFVLGSVGGSAFIAAMNVAVALAGATVTAFVAGQYAVLAALLAVPLLAERIERSTLAALGIALLGTALLADLEITGGTAAGVGVGLVAALCFALFLVLSRRWSAPYGLPAPTVALAALATSAATLAVIGAGLGDPAVPSGAGTDALLAVAYLGIGPGALAAILVVGAMRRLAARQAAALLLLNPPTAAVAAWWLLDERLTALQLVGGVLVLVALAAATLAGRSGRGSAQANGRPT